MELVAQKGVERQSYETCLLRFSQDGRPRLLFPGYLFVKIVGAWRSLTGTRGIINVIQVGDRPALIPDTYLEAWRSREDATGLVQLNLAPRFQRGDAAVIERGAFQGQTCVYEGLNARGRIDVLLQMLGRIVTVQVDDKDLAAA